MVEVLKKYRSWFLIGIVSIVWLILSLIPLYCALNFTCDPDAGSFWALFLQAIAIPIILVELYRLRRTVKESIWEPLIESTLALAPLDESIDCKSNHIKWNTRSLLESPHIENPFDFDNNSPEVKQSLSPLNLVVLNKGKAVSKHIKIVLKLISFPGTELPYMECKDNRIEILSDGRTIIYRLNEGKVLFPGDLESVNIHLGTNRSHWESIIYGAVVRDPYNQIEDIAKEKLGYLKVLSGILPQTGTYIWQMKIWSEGSNEPQNKEIILEIFNEELMGFVKSMEEEFSAKIINPYGVGSGATGGRPTLHER